MTCNWKVLPFAAEQKKEVTFHICVPIKCLSLNKTSIDVLPSKNQEVCEYCTHVSKLKHC